MWSLIQIELKKIRRSKILLILAIPVIILWMPQILNANMNFGAASGLTPEDNFLIQSFMGFSWFMFPASLVVVTVLLNQTERKDGGLIKILTLPISASGICMAKFVILLLVAGVQMCFMVILYFPCAAFTSHIHDYAFILPAKEVLWMGLTTYLASIPMAAVYWFLAVLIQTPVFSMGFGLASVVPSVFIMNTKIWYAYPMCYPFMITSTRMGQLQQDLRELSIDLVPWIPVAAILTLICIAGACMLFGRAERR